MSKKVIIRNIKKGLTEPRYAFCAFRSRFKSYLTYRFFNGRSAYPETISLFLTYGCNLRCKMCGQWGDFGASRKLSSDILTSQLTFDELKSLIDDVAFFKPNITLFGGEPFLYKEFLKLIEYIKSVSLRCNAVTNGTLLEKYAEPLVDVGMDEIIISLDGTPEIHDMIRGVPGAFGKIVRGVKRIQDVKEESRKRKPLINVAVVISELNYQNLGEIVALCADMKVSSVCFHHLIFFSKETYEKHNEEFQKAFFITSPSWGGFIREHPGIDTDSLISEIARVKNKRYDTKVYFYPDFTDEEIKRYYSGEQFVPQTYSQRCKSPWMEAYIFPDGSVRPCLSMDYIAGNIKSESFLKVWNNKLYRRYREVIKKKTFPVCAKCTEFYRF